MWKLLVACAFISLSLVVAEQGYKYEYEQEYRPKPVHKKPAMKPEKPQPEELCWQPGQYLPHKSDDCQYRVCDYGDEPWKDKHGNIKLFTVDLPCPPGLRVDRYDFDETNPCSVLDTDNSCLKEQEGYH